MWKAGWGPVGTRGGCGAGWGPGACPGGNASPWDSVRQDGRTPTRTSTRPPHPLHPAPCPYRTLGRKHLNGYDSPIRSSKFIRYDWFWSLMFIIDSSAPASRQGAPQEERAEVRTIVVFSRWATGSQSDPVVPLQQIR